MYDAFVQITINI